MIIMLMLAYSLLFVTRRIPEGNVTIVFFLGLFELCAEGLLGASLL